MKAILTFERFDVEKYQTPKDKDGFFDIQEINFLLEEHRRYYGMPHGYSEVRGASTPYKKLHYGFNVAHELNGVSQNEELTNIVFNEFNIDITDFNKFGCWLTSGLNFTGIGYTKDKVVVLLDGSRHGLRMPFYDIKHRAIWTYLETWLPNDAHPYDTRDQYASQSLENALAAKNTYKNEDLEYEKLLISLGSGEENLMSENKVISTYLKYIGNVKKEPDAFAPEALKEIKNELLAHLEIRGFKEKYQKIINQSSSKIRASYFPHEPQYIFYEQFKE